MHISSNLFGRIDDIGSEADVEALVVEPLIRLLTYPSNRVRRKESLERIRVSRGSKKELFRPDYVLQDRRRKPACVIEAKAPDEVPEAYRYQVGGYAYGLNLRFRDENPVHYAVVVNGPRLVLWEWDNEVPILQMGFEDFEKDNSRFVRLRSLLSYGALDVIRVTEEVFEFKPPEMDDLLLTFDRCHNIIRKQGHGPTPAFAAFAKLMFVKVREDSRIDRMIADGKTPEPSDFNFSVDWINDQVARGVSTNPVNDMLFRRVRDDLEDRIAKGETRRIFNKDEEIGLPNDTIIQVVRELEHFDLHSIDEDLNGRMFEKFLNATVRGPELGQFFTPRRVVKYMVAAADLTVTGRKVPRVLDGCCGSGGFLIEAMAVLSNAIDTRTDLTATEVRALKRELYRECLYGVDKSANIARIARLNMYLHGDGGSTIFSTDMLDHQMPAPTGIPSEVRDEVETLRVRLQEGLLFDVVLTNPPFSMTYKSKNEDEKRILGSYQLARTLAGTLSSTEQSNVLFIERYHGLLKDGGDLFTIIDNTVLNGTQSQKYRDYILEHFIIRQIVALPFNTFARAQAGVQTTMLHLTKRRPEDEQGTVFMAILNNIGHDNHQRETEHRDNTKKLIEVYRSWRSEGLFDNVLEPNANASETLGCPLQVFTVPASDINIRRLDAMYYAPELRGLQESLRSNGRVSIRPGKSLPLVKQISKKEEASFHGQWFKYVDIGNVTKDGAIASYEENVFEKLPTRARMHVRAGDVLFAKLRTSRGTALIVPPEFDGQFFTNGFIAVRPRDDEERWLLWSLFVSEVFTRQVYYLAVTSAQSEVRPAIVQDDFVLPEPTDDNMRQSIIEAAKQIYSSQQRVRDALDTNRGANWAMTGDIQ